MSGLHTKRKIAPFKNFLLYGMLHTGLEKQLPKAHFAFHVPAAALKESGLADCTQRNCLCLFIHMYNTSRRNQIHDDKGVSKIHNLHTCVYIGNHHSLWHNCFIMAIPVSMA